MKLVCAVTVLVLASLAQDGNAVLKREFRTLLPYSLDEFLIGYRWSIAESSILETGGGEGIQILGEPKFDSSEHGTGEYIHKILYLETKAPPIFEAMAGGIFKVHEKSWFTSTGVTTEYTEKRVMGDAFGMTIRSKFVDGDDCQQNNVLPESGSVDVIQVDFTTDIPEEQEWDPTQCSSEKLNRGPLRSDWQSDQPHMCVYSYVEVEFDWAIMQQVVEARAIDVYQSLLEKFYRQMFCWADDWADLSEKDVEGKERDTKAELNRIRNKGEVRGQIEGVSPA